VSGPQRSVGVIGSAALGPDDPAWHVGYELGGLLAAGGAIVMTGGYGGLMEAVSHGAHAGGGSVVGLPMEAWTHLEPNPYAAELRFAADYPSRLAHFLACDAVVALDGGVGTLSELALAWATAQTEPDAPHLVALGARWRRILAALAAELIVSPGTFDLVEVVDTPAEAAAAALTGTRRAGPGARG
jgi:uncharacterized protein (TIGR00725 family)